MTLAKLLTTIEERDDSIALRIPAGRTRRNYAVMAGLFTLSLTPLFAINDISLTIKGCGICLFSAMLIALRWYYHPRSRQTLTISPDEIRIESPNTEVYPRRVLKTAEIEEVFLREPPWTSAARVQAFAALQHYDPHYGIVFETGKDQIVLAGHLGTDEQRYLYSVIQEKLNLSA